MRVALAVLAAVIVAAPSPAQEVRLRAPLGTVVRAEVGPERGERELIAEVEVPADAPADLGVAAWVGDRHGGWHQLASPDRLAPGRHRLRFALGADVPLSGEPRWNAEAAASWDRGGLVFWSAGASRARLRVPLLRVVPRATATRPHRLLDLVAADAGRTGERWTLTCRPDPYPELPCDPDAFALDALIRAPDGGEIRVAGFHRQPMRAGERGDREEPVPCGTAAFAVRFRPTMPGLHQVRLSARWADGGARVVELPPIRVDGPRWDGYARVDAGDPRFLAVDGRWFWPSGPNLRSLNDTRCEERLGTRPVAERGSLAYAEWFARMRAAGANSAELWLSSWNLALEWNGSWSGYRGLGRYHQGHAWQLDRILDAAWANGVRLNLVVNNHGQASTDVDPEWAANPWNRANGGPLASAQELFTADAARAGQARMRRYLLARYADHPAIQAWEIWNELEWTDLGRYGDNQRLVRWYEESAAGWRALDPYRHPVTAHWSDPRSPWLQRFAALEGYDLIATNAYRDAHETFAQRIGAIHGRFAPLRKPILINEAGGSNENGMEARLASDHACAGWLALVHGFAGTPLLWWANWLDQRGGFAPYTAVARFLDGEDLRGAEAGHRRLSATLAGTRLWAGAWARPGRMLGYVLDEPWQRSGGAAPVRSGASVNLSVAAGPIRVQWFDADRGDAVGVLDLDHPGGELSLPVPPFRRHLAFKAWRRDGRRPDQASR